MKKIRKYYVVSFYPTLLAALLVVYHLELIAADPESSKNGKYALFIKFKVRK